MKKQDQKKPAAAVPSSLDALLAGADPLNPRKITSKSATALGESLDAFGDISGVVFNLRTSQLVTWHQRLHRLQARYGSLAIIPEGDHGYIDVIVGRWENYTGKKAILERA